MSFQQYPAPQMGTEGDVIGKRLLAFLLDTVIMSVLAGVLVGIGFAMGDTIGILFTLLATAVLLGYKFVLEGLYGHTPGKYILGLVVVKSDGSNISIGSSLIRNLLLIVDNLPTAYLVGLALIFFTDKNQRVGDLAADTVVVARR